jgi:hypothetical protein
MKRDQEMKDALATKMNDELWGLREEAEKGVIPEGLGFKMLQVATLRHGFKASSPKSLWTDHGISNLEF